MEEDGFPPICPYHTHMSYGNICYFKTLIRHNVRVMGKFLSFMLLSGDWLDPSKLKRF